LDSAVDGLGFSTPSLSGLTQNGGEFQYRSGEVMTFFITNTVLGQTLGADIITPLQLAQTQSLDNPQVINTVRLLQTLDEDATASNGIVINAQTSQKFFEQDIRLDVVDGLTFETDLLALVENDILPHSILIDATMALEHFTASLQQQLGGTNSAASSE
jgi:hypothetical protein